MRPLDPNLPAGGMAHATRQIVISLNSMIASGNHSDTEILRGGLERCLMLIGQLEAANRQRLIDDRVDRIEDR